MNLREKILAADDLPREPIDIPEWGFPVSDDGSAELFVATMSGEERDDFEASMVQQRGKSTTQNLKNVRAKLAVRTLVDKDGNRVFQDVDAPALGKKGAPALQRVFEKARKLNRLSNEDVEELAGNSPAAQSGDSTSD